MKRSVIKKIVLISIAFFYCTGYYIVRSQSLLVHQVTCATDQQDNTKKYFHRIISGDLGIPVPGDEAVWVFTDVCYVLFTPLRFVEAGYWTMLGP